MSWPYDDGDAAIAEPNAPEWGCPEGICECHPVEGGGEEYELSVMLFSPEGERMKGARCRILHQGRVVNEDQPYADGSGWVTAVVPHRATSVLVEWAPADTPKRKPYPFRKWFYVDLDQERDEAARRRLHNLGYSRYPSLKENVKAFQREYGEEHPSGKVEDIEADLIEYHDEGRVPRRPLTGRGGATPTEPSDHAASTGEGQTSRFVPGDDIVGDRPPGAPAKQPPAGAPPTKGATKIAYGSAMFPLALPSVVDVLSKGEGLYEFVRVFTQAKTASKTDIAGYFWIFGEALTWKVDDTDAWKAWTRSYSPLPHKPRIGSISETERERTCRLPCDALQSQAAADMVFITQEELLDTTADGMRTQFPPTTKVALPCVLPTPRLYDALYLGADVRMKFVDVKGMDDRSRANMANEYNDRVNQELRAKVAGRSTPVKSLGTPGKIWAAHPDIERWQWEEHGHFWYVCSINYGFHTGKATAEAFQTPGSRHNTAHADYSQILVLVAGWCLVMGPNDKHFVWKPTADVYRSQDYAPLIRSIGRPLSRIRYEGTPQGGKPSGQGPHWEPEQ